MANLNVVHLIGRVGRDPEMRYTPNGTAVTNFSIAINRYSTDTEGEKKEQVEWVSIVAWTKLAETCNQMLTKGRLVYIEGRLQTRSWETQDGQRRLKTEVVANTMQVLDPKRGTEAAAEPVAEDDDDIPF